MTNRLSGFSNGSFPNSKVINLIADAPMFMGTDARAVIPPSGELLPRVRNTTHTLTGEQIIGIVVGGDNDGTFNDPTDPLFTTNERNFAATEAGQTVKVCIQGICPAMVFGGFAAEGISIGDPLTSLGQFGFLFERLGSQAGIFARALHPLVTLEQAYIFIDIQMERPGVLI